MKKALLVLAVFGVLLVSACGSSSAAISKMDVKAFADAASQPGVVLLDVRSPEEFAAGHLPGAVNINVEDSGFADAIAKLDKNATYAVYCQSGRRSGIATSQMAEAGFATLFDLQGGVQAWKQAGGELTTQ